MRALLLFALMAGWPSIAAAQETADALAEQTARSNAVAAALNAKAAAINAEAALADANRKALGLPTFEGKTTVDASGGEIESWMLSAGTINEAADHIVKALSTTSASRIVLLSRDDPFDLALPGALEAEIGALRKSLATASARAGCSAFDLSTQPSVAAGLPIAPIIGAAMGVLRTDTDVAGLSVAAPDRTLINAIAGRGDRQWVVPSEAVDPSADSPLRAAHATLLAERDQAFACRSQIAARLKKDEPQDQIAILDNVITRTDTFHQQVAAPSDKGQSLLSRAIILASLKQDGVKVLRVGVEKAGGSRLKRANLWTSLGAPAIGITGGLVTTYRLVDPATGVVEKAGLLTCRTVMTSMRAVQNGKVGQSACGPSPKKITPSALQVAARDAGAPPNGDLSRREGAHGAVAGQANRGRSNSRLRR